jgi:hypothetical protein
LRASAATFPVTRPGRSPRERTVLVILDQFAFVEKVGIAGELADVARGAAT